MLALREKSRSASTQKRGKISNRRIFQFILRKAATNPRMSAMSAADCVERRIFASEPPTNSTLPTEKEEMDLASRVFGRGVPNVDAAYTTHGASTREYTRIDLRGIRRMAAGSLLRKP